MKKRTLINWIMSLGLICLLGFSVLYMNNINLLNRNPGFYAPQQKKMDMPGFKYAMYGNKQASVMLQYPVSAVIDKRCIFVVDQDAGDIKGFDLEGRLVALFGRFKSPYGITQYGGNLYVSDMGTGQIVIYSELGQRLGNLVIKNQKNKTMPGSLLAHDKNLYVADPYQGKILVYNLPERKLVKTIGGKDYQHGQLKYPHGMAFDKSGNLYVADSGNNRVVVFDTQGKFLKTIGDSEKNIGTITTVRGVAVDQKGMIYATSPLAGAIEVFNQNGTLVSSFGGPGQLEGQLGLPNDIYTDNIGRLYITEIKNKRISVFER